MNKYFQYNYKFYLVNRKLIDAHSLESRDPA